MAIKKSELYSSLWKSCDELRGSMDASQYKDYVLILLFVKYVSDKYGGQPGALFEVPLGGSFADMVALRGDKEIGDKINKIINRLAEKNDLKGVIDVADFNNPDKLGKGKEMQDRLSNLVAIFDNPALNFSKNRAEGDDILGDAYEYLMRHFATESGKSKGQFYTPAEVSRIMAKIIGINKGKSSSQTIYDPTCGSGSLLLKAADEAGGKITIYGQEMDNATAALAKMNMILHDNPTAEIWQDNSLSQPHFKDTNGNLKTFDFAVANPPFSTKAWSHGFDPLHDEYERFVDGVPPARNGDYAFLAHIIRSLKSTGKGAIILPHGVLFRGNAEGEIRKNIIRRGYIKGIIGLPPNLFYGTSIPACIIIIDKENAANSAGIFMIDASKGYIKDGNKNRLRQQDIHKIVDTFNKRLDLPGYALMVNYAEIKSNDYNLNIPRYIDSSEAEDIQDIEAHLLGGIPDRDIEALENYWQTFPTLKGQLFKAGSRPGYSQLKVETGQIKHLIFNHPEFMDFTRREAALCDRWKADILDCLLNIGPDNHPKQIIEDISEKLLRVFTWSALVDKYDVYQHLMSYWAEKMQDDVYMLVSDGWQANSELIPATLVINRYFSDDRQNIEKLELARGNLAVKLEELEEEHGAEGGLLEEAKNEKGKLTKVTIKARLKDISGEIDTGDENQLLNEWLSLNDWKAEAEKAVKEAQKRQDSRVAAKYPALSQDEVKTLVVHDKWFQTLENEIQTELNRVSQSLSGRIIELAERYATPMTKLSADLEVFSTRVQVHLQKMGFIWD